MMVCWYLMGLISFCVAGFVLGLWVDKPRVITKTEQVKVYDLTQNPEIIEAYANTIGKAFVDKNEKQEIEMMRHKIWQEGWFEGFRNASLQCE